MVRLALVVIVENGVHCSSLRVLCSACDQPRKYRAPCMRFLCRVWPPTSTHTHPPRDDDWLPLPLLVIDRMQAMKNLGPESIANVTSTYALDSGSTYTYTWNVTFSAALGDVPEMTIEPANADLSSVGADVQIETVQVN